MADVRHMAAWPCSRAAIAIAAIGLSMVPALAEQTGATEKPSQQRTTATDAASKDGGMTMAAFLDRLMMAESGGRDGARNPRSTAVGPFQFIESTFLYVARKYFPEETAKLSREDVLALRTKRAFARRVAEAYTKENAEHLAGAGHEASYANLRLAFFAGPGGAVRVLSAPREARAGTVLGAAAVAANPFLARMSVADLIVRAARDLAIAPDDAGRVATGQGKVRRHPAIIVRCDLSRASCQKWLALAERRLRTRKSRTTQR